jgi:hypothetical protein
MKIQPMPLGALPPGALYFDATGAIATVTPLLLGTPGIDLLRTVDAVFPDFDSDPDAMPRAILTLLAVFSDSQILEVVQ